MVHMFSRPKNKPSGHKRVRSFLTTILGRQRQSASGTASTNTDSSLRPESSHGQHHVEPTSNSSPGTIPAQDQNTPPDPDHASPGAQIDPPTATPSRKSSLDEQSVALTKRARHVEKLKAALLKGLTAEEHKGLALDDALIDAQQVVDSVVTTFREKCAVANAQQNRRNKTDQILEGLEKAAKICDVAIQYSPQATTLVWSGVKLLLQVAANDAEKRQIMESAMESIVTGIGTCGFYEAIYISLTTESVAKLGDSLVDLYAAIIVFCVRAAKHIESSGIGVSAAKTLASTNAKLKTCIEDIKAKEKVMRGFAGMVKTEDDIRRFEELHSLATGLVEDLREMKVDLKTGLSDVKQLQQEALTELQKKSLRESRLWLGGLEMNAENDKNNRLHLAGTNEWIFDHIMFKNWSSGAVQVLWISGIPGAGKSVLLAFILERLQQKSSSPILHFFFKNGDPITESPVTMLATLIDQLVQQHQSSQLVQLLHQAKENSNALRCTSFKVLWALFMALLGAFDPQFGPILVLVDALDECVNDDSRKDFLKYVSGTDFDWEGLGVRFLFTSRVEPDITAVLAPSDAVGPPDEPCRVANIKLDNELVKKDIIHFVTEQTGSAGSKFAKLKPFRQIIIATLPDKSQGMFRYAALMLDQLCKPSTADVERTLASIPGGLNNMYVWILEHFNDDPEELYFRKTVLMWIAMAARPLSVHEVALAYAASDEVHHDCQMEFDPMKKTLVGEDDILRACGAFVEVTPKKELHFTHFSVKEFLLVASERDRASLLRKGSLVRQCLLPDIGLAHGAILQTCMTQLLSMTFLNGLNSGGYDRSGASKVVYSVVYWLHHAMATQDTLSPSSLQYAGGQINPWPSVCRFLWNSPLNTNFIFWKECLFPRGDNESPYQFSTCLYDDTRRMYTWPLHIMACFGLRIPLLQCAFDMSTPWDMQDASQLRPVSLAAINGHTETVRLILERGVDIDPKSLPAIAPIFQAAIYGRTEVVKLLLEKGANPDGSGDGMTPLSQAAENGYIEIVKLLLAAGADIEKANEYGAKPLTLAALGGHIEIVKLLLDNDAEIDYDDGNGPLAVVAELGHTEIAKLLFDHKKAIVSVKGKNGRTPLSRAAANGHTEIVKLLLDEGAEVDIEDDDLQTPLALAAQGGHVAVAKLLLEKGAEIDKRDIRGRTPFALSTLHFREYDLVKLLLEHGADVEAADHDGATALDWIVQSGGDCDCDKIVELLLKYGARPEKEDGCGQTQLYHAVRYNSPEVLYLLLLKVVQVHDHGTGTPCRTCSHGLCYICAPHAPAPESELSDRELICLP